MLLGAPGKSAPAADESASGPTSDLDDLRRRFCAFEAEHDLFAWEIGGARMWDYMRVEVFDRAVAELGLLGEKHAPPDWTWRGYLKEARGIARSVLTRHPFLAAPVDAVFLGHPRRRLESDGTWWDPYSDPVIEALDTPSLLVERPWHNRHLGPARTRRMAHLDALALGAAALRPLLGEPFAAAEGERLDQLARLLKVEFAVALPVRQMVRAKLRLRRSQLPLWRAFLRRAKPRVLFLVVSYGNEIPIEACRLLGIPTVELQHGIVSPNNLGYHFPEPGHCKQLFPDWFFAFGDFWRDAAAFPCADERVVSVGYPYLEQRRAAAEAQRNRRALFLSQRSIGAALSKMAVEVAQRSGEGEVWYKLHPGERSTWRADYPWLVDAPLRVIEGDEPHLYDLFPQVTLQVGVYSTALFEGLAFGLATRVARLPGWEAMRAMVDTTAGVRWAEAAEDIAAALREDATAACDAARFFRPGARENLRDAVARVHAGGSRS